MYWWFQVENMLWEILSRYRIWLLGPRWLIPKVAQPQIPPSKSQKRVKLISVCALTQQDKKQDRIKESGGVASVVGIVLLSL